VAGTTLAEKALKLLSDHRTEDDAASCVDIAHSLGVGIPSVQTIVYKLRNAGHNVVTAPGKPTRYFLDGSKGPAAKPRVKRNTSPTDPALNAYSLLRHLAEKRGVSLEAVLAEQQEKRDKKEEAKVVEKARKLQGRIGRVLDEYVKLGLSAGFVRETVERAVEDWAPQAPAEVA